MRRARFVLLALPLVTTFACAGAPAQTAPVPELPLPGASASVPPGTSSSAAKAPPAPSTVAASSLFAPDAPLEGSVVLSPDAKLYPTANAALAAPKPTAPPRYVGSSSALVFPVLESSSGAVKVRTEGDTRDCAWSRTISFSEPAYAIEAFAPREQLVARLARAVMVEHADGTGAWASKGAVLRVLADGRAELVDETLAKVIGFVPRDRIALATTANKDDAGPAWKRVLSPLACDPKPQSVDDWRAGESKRRQAEADKEREAERQRQYEACLERERNTPPAPPPPAGRPTIFGTVKLSCADIFRGGGVGWGLGGFRLGERGVEPPYCTARAPEENRDIAARVDGKPFAKLSSIVASSTGSTKVGQGAAGSYVAEIPRTCGGLRVEVPEEALGRGGSGAGIGGLGGGGVLYPRAGSDVTWPDGTRAGKVSRSGAVRENSLTPTADDRLCRRVAPFAEPLCQSKNDLCRTLGCRDGR